MTRNLHRPERHTVVVATAVVVAAVAVPGALLVGDSSSTFQEAAPPSRSLPSAPIYAGSFDLLQGVSPGEPPTVAYVRRRTLVEPDGTTVRLPRVYDQLVRLGQETHGVHGDRHGNRVVDVLDTEGIQVDRRVIETNVSVSTAGDLAAWATPQGEVVLRWAGGGMTLGNQGGPVTVAAVVGRPPCSSEEDGCRVYVNNRDQRPPQWVTPEGSVGPVAPGALRVDDVHPDGLEAVLLSSRPTGSCSGVFDTTSSQLLWRTCRNSLFRFSPDGAYVLAGAPYLDGLGLNSLDVLDARTGRRLVRFTITGGFIAQQGWEDSSHPLVVLSGPNGWELLRLGLDGSRERAAGPVRAAADPTFKLLAFAGNR